MKKLSKILSVILVAALTLSYAVPAFAGSDDSVYVYAYSGETEKDTVDNVDASGDGYVEGAVVGAAAWDDNAEAGLTVSGDVNATSEDEYYDCYADGVSAYAWANEDNNANASATVGGDVNATATGGENTGCVNSVGVISVSNVYGEGTAYSSVNVDGDVNAVSTDKNENGGSENCAVGIDMEAYADGEGYVFPTVNVGGDVSAVYTGNNANYRVEAEAVGIYMESTVNFGGYAGSSLNVDGNISAVSDLNAIGVYAAGGIHKILPAMTLADEESSDSSDYINNLMFISANGITAEGGDTAIGLSIWADRATIIAWVGEDGIEAEGELAAGAAINAYENSKVSMAAEGDVSGTTCGLYIDMDDTSIIDVLIEGTISGEEAAVIIDSQDIEDCVTLTIWKAELNEDGAVVGILDPQLEVADSETDEEDPLAETAAAIEENILYIIKVEQPEAGGTLSATAADGEVLDQSHGWDVAYEGDTVLLKVNVADGYKLTGAYNGVDGSKVTLLQDSDGNYYVVVPKGGGVYLTATFEKLPEEEAEEEAEEEEEPEVETPVQAAEKVNLLVRASDKEQDVTVSFYDNGMYIAQLPGGQTEGGTFRLENGIIVLNGADGNKLTVSEDSKLIYASEEIEFTDEQMAILIRFLKSDLVLTVVDNEQSSRINFYRNGAYEAILADGTVEYGIAKADGDSLYLADSTGIKTALGEDNTLEYTAESKADQKYEFEFAADEVSALVEILKAGIAVKVSDADGNIDLFFYNNGIYEARDADKNAEYGEFAVEGGKVVLTAASGAKTTAEDDGTLKYTSDKDSSKSYDISISAEDTEKIANAAK